MAAMTGLDGDAFSGVQGYALATLMFVALFLIFEAILLSFARRTATRGDLKRRLSKSDGSAPPHVALVKMRQKRSLSASGEYTMPMIWLNRLVVQSGVTWGVAGLPLLLVGLSVGIGASILLLGGNAVVAFICAMLGGIGMPLLYLTAVGNRRRRKFEAQLPDAIDILVRSLKVGHPVATAIRSVARELPDPTGTEFGIVADELTYGLDLETAMSNLSARVGQQDLALVVVAVGIQAKSGGNLAEILGGISKVIRDRLRMRLKVKALSAEGRFSALVLSILPFGLFGLLWLIAPHFYGEVWHFAHVKPALVAATMWMIIGDLIMYRMVKFEI
jgi:tight adherence protein B